MYEEKQTFDVLKGTVPDFSTKDINLAFTIDGKTDTNAKFPNKGEGYVVEKVDCEDNVTADWNNGSWSLENVKNNGEAKKVKCTVKFKTIDKTSGLNGAEPVLGDGMIPVIIKENGKVYKTTEDNKDWYDYEKHIWANAVILTENAPSYEDNAEISETDIESYFVWIPKFSYQLFDIGKYATAMGVESKNNMVINIRFGVINTEDGEGECKTPMLDNGVQGASGESWHCKVGDYMTHPAFLAFDTPGFWVGKFETSYNNGIQVKPNVISWIRTDFGTAYPKLLAYQPDLQSHLVKNTEWGAVAYLTQSIYGRCDKSTNDCEDVSVNSMGTYNNNSYYTGYTGNTAYGGSNEQLASTTGNYSGIYDMSGGAWEYTAVIILDGNNKTPISTSQLTADYLKNPRYYDIYNYGIDYTHWERRILGDATSEIGPFASISGSAFVSSINNAYARFICFSYPYMVRGAECGDGVPASLFSFCTAAGNGDYNSSFRIVLAPKV